MIVKLNQKGAALVTLLVFTVMATVIISAVVAITIINTQSTATLSKGAETYNLAEIGIEEAIVRLLRDPTNYTGGTLNIGSNPVIINVTGGSTKTVVSEATSGNFKRKIQVTATVQNNQVTILTWQEIQ